MAEPEEMSGKDEPKPPLQLTNNWVYDHFSPTPIPLREGSTLTPIGTYSRPPHHALDQEITFRSPGRVYIYNQEIMEARNEYTSASNGEVKRPSGSGTLFLEGDANEELTNQTENASNYLKPTSAPTKPQRKYKVATRRYKSQHQPQKECIKEDESAYGLHAMENPFADTEPEYTCPLCKDDRTAIWGVETRKFCRIVRQAYEKITNFKKNLHQVPANKVGKMFLAKYAETLEWTNKEGREEHIGWYVNTVLPAICLLVKDQKASWKQRTELLRTNMMSIENGQIELVIAQACSIQHKIARRKKVDQNKRRSPNWISTIRAAVQQGEMTRASRMLDEKDLGVEPPSHATYQRISQMFYKRRDIQAILPTPDGNCTVHSHITPKQVMKAI